MCAPVPLIIAAAGFIVQAGGAIMQEVEQQKAHEENKKAANEAAVDTMRALGLRQQQEQAATKQSIFSMDLESRRADALNRVASGESGVSGASIDILLSDAVRQRQAIKQTTETNQSYSDLQTDAERKGVYAQRQARINSVRPASIMGAALRIGGAAVGLAGDLKSREPNTEVEAPKRGGTK